MSSLQDIPLEVTSDNSLPSPGLETSTPKSNSLKRFFKIGNKKSSGSQGSCEDVSASALTEADKEAAAATGGAAAGKTNTLSRLFTRMKVAQRSDGLDPASTISKMTTNIDNEVEAVADTQESPRAAGSTPEKPVPNAKPTLKTSISSYWKLLFNRQKATAYQQSKGKSVEAQQSLHHVDEVQELEMVQQPSHDESTLAGPSSADSTYTMITSQQQDQTKALPDDATMDNSVAKTGGNLD